MLQRMQAGYCALSKYKHAGSCLCPPPRTFFDSGSVHCVSSSLLCFPGASLRGDKTIKVVLHSQVFHTNLFTNECLPHSQLWMTCFLWEHRFFSFANEKKPKIIIVIIVKTNKEMYTGAPEKCLEVFCSYKKKERKTAEKFPVQNSSSTPSATKQKEHKKKKTTNKHITYLS